MQTQPEIDYWAAVAALEWQLELGADTPVLDAPVDCYALPDKVPEALARPQAEAAAPAAADAARLIAPAVARARHAGPDPVEAARMAAAAAGNLEALAEAVAAFDLCDLRKGARSTVFADGNPAARVMVIGEAPGREEDLAGRPFVGAAGQLLDRMLAAIGLRRDAPDALASVYITNVLPWRPPGNRDPEPAEIAMMRPFLARHVELAAPDLIVLMGNSACLAALERRGILRLRGTWAEAWGRPALQMTHPSYLLRTPEAKREAWADLLSLRARLDGR